MSHTGAPGQAPGRHWVRGGEDGLPRVIGPYSLGVRTGTVVFTAGMVPVDSERNVVGAGDIRAQTEQTLANPKATVRVYFDTKALRAGEAVLVVTAPDCPGLLLAVTRSLFKRRAEIVASEIRTEDGVALDRFTICGTGGIPLGPDSLADIQQQVLSTVRRLRQRFLHQD